MPVEISEYQYGGIVTGVRSGSVEDVVDKLVTLIEHRGMKVFTVIDHSSEAKRIGSDLRDTKVVLFGSPDAGTPIMAARPLMALDLPLRVLVWEGDGQTMVSYTEPEVLAARHHLTDDLASRIAGIGPLVDELIG